MKKLRKILTILCVVAIALSVAFYFLITALKAEYGEKTWINDVISLKSPHQKTIKITEKVTKAAWPSGTYQAQLELHFFNGDQWRSLDKSFKRTPVYSKLYDPTDRFIQVSDPLAYYQNLETKDLLDSVRIEEAQSKRYPTAGTYKTPYIWDIFISPDDVSLEDYEIVCSLIRENLEAIHAAIQKPRAPEDQGEDIGRHPIIASIVYRRYDYAPIVGIQHSVNVHFKSDFSKVFISQAPPNQIVIMLPEHQAASNSGRSFYKSDSIGLITDDQKYVLVKEPRDPAIQALVGGNWLDFYRSCVNDKGYNIFYYFEPIPWSKKDEKNSSPLPPRRPWIGGDETIDTLYGKRRGGE